MKRVTGDNRRHGLTGMALSLGVMVGHRNLEAVRAALAEVRTREVWNWCRTHLGATVQSVRAKIREALATEHKRPPLPSEYG